MIENIYSPEYESLHDRMINSSTAEDVKILVLEAGLKGFNSIVGEGRQMLISWFGYKKVGNELIAPEK